jgi:AcrR family transcriptional regulator
MDDIARAAEVSKGTLYLYFQNKDHLYLAIANQSLDELIERLAALPAEGSGFERVQRVFLEYARFAEEQSVRFRTGMSWILSSYPASEESEGFSQHRELIGRLYSHCAEAIDHGRSDGSVRDDTDTAQLVLQLWAGSLAVLTLHMGSAKQERRLPPQLIGVGPDEAIDDRAAGAPVRSFVELMLRGIRAPSSPSHVEAVASPAHLAPAASDY